MPFPHSPPRVWFGSWPFRYILLCPPLGSVIGRGIRVRHWRVFWGRITSASDARSFSLVFLSAGFGALCSGVSSRSLPLTPGLSLLSFCRLALGLCVLVFLRALCLSAICIIDISMDQLCGSLHESAKCVRARRSTSLRFYPMARVGFRETCVRMPHSSTYPSPSSCALQVLWPPR